MSNVVTTEFRAEGFACPSCVSKLEGALKKMNGVENATVHYATSRFEVTHDPEVASTDSILDTVAKTGYSARPMGR